MTRRLGLALALAAGACASPDAGPVVFAASSTADVAGTVAGRAGLGGAVVSVGASSTLARQIARGAPADAFLTADPAWVDWLVREGVRVVARRVVARGRLVVVGPRSAAPAASLAEALGGAERVALGDPTHVPAGRYARAALLRAGIWAPTAPRVLPTADGRAALAAVETGAADRAVVYASDARASSRVRVLAEVPRAVTPPIRFEAVALTRRGRAVVAALADSAGRAAWEAAGFSPP